MEKFICIHGHFYQPPRENPWLEEVEVQDSAFPYHDWNERITAECYAPNAHARFVDGEGRIEQILSNYSRISFNFGPTLLSWMKEKAGDIYEAILEADKESRQRFSGHGSALAQCYNHLIMPLANRRDKATQALWGLRDFEARFGRPPEGMWLPETAADDESLDVLAELGIKFTVLSPFQASRMRPLDKNEDWLDVNGGKVDPSTPYLVNLPSGRSITVFFYDGPLSKAVAFEKLLGDGKRFANRLSEAFVESRPWDQLVHIATDGESYGHHHRSGEMALAYALRCIEKDGVARLTNYGEFLEKHPPSFEAQIHQGSAWSCSHGVDRWRRNCGCNSGMNGSWNQEWREPLRHALDWLRDRMAPAYKAQAKAFFKDPWAARDDYISVILNRSTENTKAFFTLHCTHELSESEEVTALRMLEMQRHALLMYTSCGWFFDEISGIETVQIIQYAARAIQLADDILDKQLEPGFLDILAKAKSNIPENQDGRNVYTKFVKPALMTRESAAAHYAVSSLFESYPEKARIYSFAVLQEDRQLFTAGNARLAVGKIKVIFATTRNSDLLIYGVLHMGDHNLNCGVRFWQEQDDYARLVKETSEAFTRADFPDAIRAMDRHFGHSHYSLKSLFRDEQRKVLGQILGSTYDELFNTYKLMSDRHTPLIRFLADLGAPVPKGLQLAVEFALNRELLRQFEGDTLDKERITSILAESQSARVTLEGERLAYAAKGHLDRLSELFQKTPEDLAVLERFEVAATLARLLPSEVSLWKPQNTYYNLSKSVREDMCGRAGTGDENAKKWLEHFRGLGEQLGFRVESAAPAEKKE